MAKRRRGDYRRAKQHVLRTNFRLEKTGTKPTREEVEEVFERIRETHRVPKGWRFAAMEWSHSASGTRGWHEGTIRDLRQFELAMDAMMEDMRIGIDRAKSREDVWEIEIAMEY